MLSVTAHISSREGRGEGEGLGTGMIGVTFEHRYYYQLKLTKKYHVDVFAYHIKYRNYCIFIQVKQKVSLENFD